MIIDIHVHTADYSSCSNIDLENGILQAKKIGLDGICITDHESNEIADKANDLAKKHDFLVIVGMELLTYEGDLLIFGLDQVPAEKMHANELINLVSKKGGVVISAHPFREFKGINRAMGEYIRELDGLSGIEAFNGNTKLNNNFKAYNLGVDLGMPCSGGSDAHTVERVGKYATKFSSEINNINDLIKAIKDKSFSPVMYYNNKFKEIDDENKLYISTNDTTGA